MFPISPDSPARFTLPLPDRFDTLVIGGGVIGVMTAWYLAKARQKVVLCEKGRVAGEQSSRNWGWVRQQGRDPSELPIAMEANRIWRGLSKECGEDLGFRQTGVLYLANSEKDLAGFENWLEFAKAHQLDTRMLSRAELSAMLSGARADWPGGLWTASDGRAEPWIAVPALARHAERLGVTIIEDCAVRVLDLADGRVTGAVTEKGRIACDNAVLAGGAWSSLFLRKHGIEIPQLSVRATVAATEPMPEVFAGQAADNHFAFRRRADGGYSLALGSFHELFIGPDAFRRLPRFLPQLRASPFGTSYRPWAARGFPDAWGTKRRWNADDISPFEQMRVLNPAPNAGAVRRMQNLFAAAFPALGRPRIRLAWAGMIDTMPDVVPVVDCAPSIKGLVIATGMSGHGFGIGPAFGRIVADLVLGNPPVHDMSRFRFSRFSDGSKIELGPSL
ncbi:MAG: FAD-binding oxidoreductase [Alteraurantiacibacter sp.]|nr:FAD-binding oxidoreductase [Alteraurantiacibacter sp.]